MVKASHKIQRMDKRTLVHEGRSCRLLRLFLQSPGWGVHTTHGTLITIMLSKTTARDRGMTVARVLETRPQRREF